MIIDIQSMMLGALLGTYLVTKIGPRIDTYVTKKTNWCYEKQQLTTAVILLGVIVVPLITLFTTITVIRWDSL